jgi:hypothetical protein
MSGSELILSGITPVDPVAISQPLISGLVAWAFFGSTWSSDGTNLVPGGPAIVNVGAGPLAIRSNHVSCRYDGALRLDWQRYADGGDAPITIIVVGRSTSVGMIGEAHPIAGDVRLHIRTKEVDVANDNAPTVFSIRLSVQGPTLAVPTVRSWRAWALTEPAGGVAGTCRIMDLTADAEATLSAAGQSSNAGSANYFHIGTSAATATGTQGSDIAFVGVVSGQQMTRAAIQSDAMASVRSLLELRGITGV